ncbi:MAG: hypothetical protein M0014_16370 [Actinomycetota bacterium]|nr:hypothetical protein [Actinomycetota bacterium]
MPLLSLFAATGRSGAAANAVDLRVLVVANATPGVQAILAELAAEGVPYQEVDLTSTARTTLSSAFLASSGEAHFQAVVLPNATGTTYDTSGNIVTGESLTPAELSALASYESSFHIRQVDAQQTPSAQVGMSSVITAGAPSAAATVTTAGKANGFGYLNGPLALSSTSYIAYGTALSATSTPPLPTGASFTTLVSVPIPGSSATGVYLGEYANAGVDQLVITAALYRYFPEFQALGHGIVTWMTYGVHLGYNRYYFTTQVDDVFTPDAVWNPLYHCTPGEDCPLNANLQSIYPVVQDRMDSSDVNALVAWQQQNDYRLTLVFNGGNASVASGGTTPDNQDGGLTSALLAAKNDFMWVNHTWDHEYLGCLETLTANANDLPLIGCATNSNGQVIWVPQITDNASFGEQSMSIQNEILKNIAWATANALPNFDPSVLVSGDYSGLAAPPSLTDNPNFVAEVDALGLVAVASDASRPGGDVARVLGSGPSVTTPRYPINLFYNAPNLIDEVNEYNWLYVAQGQGGNCVNTTVTTCMAAPLPDATETEATQSFTSTILPQIDAFVLQRVFSNDPRPIMVHAGNFVGASSGGDRDVYPFLDSVLNSYRSEMNSNAPIVEINLAEEATLLSEDATWNASWSPSTGSGVVQAYEENGSVVVTNTGPTTLAVPFTVPTGTTSSGAPFGSSYAGEQSAWTSIPGGSALTLSVPGPVPTFTSPNKLEVGVGAAFNFSVTTSGQPPAALSLIGALPHNVSFTDNGDGTGVLSGTVDQAGTWPLTLSAQNAFGTTTQDFTLTVVNTAPIASGSVTPPPVMSPPPSLPPPTGGGAGGGTPGPGPAPQAQQAPWFPGAHQARRIVGHLFSVKIVARGIPTPTIAVLHGRLARGLSTKAVPGALIIQGNPKFAGIVRLILNAKSSAGTAHQAYKLVLDKRPRLMRNKVLLVAGRPTRTMLTVAGTPRPRVVIIGTLPRGLKVGLGRKRNVVVIMRAIERATGRFVVTVKTFNRAGRSTARLVVTVRPAATAR